MTDKSRVNAYYRWYEKQYNIIVGIDELKKTATEKNLPTISKSCDNFHTPFSSIWRHESMGNLKYIASPRKTEYIITVFKIARRNKDLQYQTSYAFLYTYIDVDIIQSFKSAPSSKDYSKFIHHEFTSFSPTYKSADGEYRHRFLPIKQLQTHRKNHINIFDDVETFAARHAKKGHIAFETATFYPELIRNNDQFKTIKKCLIDSIDLERFTLVLFAPIWIIELKRIIENKSENHIADGFHDAMFSKDLVDESPIWDIHEDFLTNHSGKFFHRLIHISPSSDQETLVSECGQKFILLTVHELESMNDIRLAPWREMFIRSQVGDLVINGINPGVPIMNDWFLVARDKELFDNRVNQVRMDHSWVASDIIKKIESARKGTYVIDPAARAEIYISYKMNGLSQATEIPMDYAEREIVLGYHMLVALEEHLGRTVADLPALMMHESYRRPLGPMFKDMLYFRKYIFEFINTLWCLNDKLGVVHGDLHLNNCTIFQKVPTIVQFTGEIRIPNTYCVFGVSGNYYIFPHMGKHSAIIDFSRAFIWKNLENNFTPNQIMAIQRNHKTRMMQTLKRDLPDFMESRSNDIELVLERHFEESFRIFQALDTWKLMSGIHMLIEQRIMTNPDYLRAYGDAKVLKNDIIPFVESIKIAAFDFITKYFELLIQKTGRETIEVPQPNLLIIQKFFQDNRVEKFNQNQEVNLVDVFSDSNPMKYNIREYEKFPPTVSLDYVVKNKIPVDAVRIDRHKIMKKYSKENPSDEQIKELSEEIQNTKSDRRGTPDIASTDDEKKLVDKLKIQIESQDDLYFSS